MEVQILSPRPILSDLHQFSWPICFCRHLKRVAHSNYSNYLESVRESACCRIRTLSNTHSIRVWAVFLFVLSLTCSDVCAQGPPYQTDDPVPVELHHYEFYIFGAADGTPVEMDSSGPAFEFNWGALPRLQLLAVLPFGVAAPLNNPVYLPSGTGPTEFGLTDMELGAKIAFIKESKHIPQIGSFTMFEIPTGNADKGLGIGKVWYKIPVPQFKPTAKLGEFLSELPAWTRRAPFTDSACERGIRISHHFRTWLVVLHGRFHLIGTKRHSSTRRSLIRHWRCWHGCSDDELPTMAVSSAWLRVVCLRSG